MAAAPSIATWARVLTFVRSVVLFTTCSLIFFSPLYVIEHKRKFFPCRSCFPPRMMRTGASFNYIAKATRRSALLPGALLFHRNAVSYETKKSPVETGAMRIQKTALHILLSSRLYCRFWSFTKSALRLADCTADREFPGTKLGSFIRVTLPRRIFFYLCAYVSTLSGFIQVIFFRSFRISCGFL